jgi:hypothetical protein
MNIQRIKEIISTTLTCVSVAMMLTGCTTVDDDISAGNTDTNEVMMPYMGTYSGAFTIDKAFVDSTTLEVHQFDIKFSVMPSKEIVKHVVPEQYLTSAISSIKDSIPYFQIVQYGYSESSLYFRIPSDSYHFTVNYGEKKHVIEVAFSNESMGVYDTTYHLFTAIFKVDNITIDGIKVEGSKDDFTITFNPQRKTKG